MGAYGASKAALLQLARWRRKKAQPRGVRVNAILPGGVQTPIWREIPVLSRDDRRTRIGSSGFRRPSPPCATPLGSYARPEEIAGQIAFLLSPASGSMTRAALIVDGGYTL